MSNSIFPITQEVTYVLDAEKPEQTPQLQALSARTGIPVLNKASEGFCLCLRGDGALELYSLLNPKQKIQVDFTSGEFQHRIKTSGKQQPLAKAIGVAKGLTKVLDVTGGLGGDAMILASLGCQMTICERHPVIALLLENGLEMARVSLDFASNVELKTVDALTYLNELKENPQVIYLDPMYPAKDKSALPRKEMQILEELVGADHDQTELFTLALKKASDRVVVKRPRAAPAFGTPTHSFEGTTTRYDMYLLKKAPP